MSWILAVLRPLMIDHEGNKKHKSVNSGAFFSRVCYLLPTKSRVKLKFLCSNFRGHLRFCDKSVYAFTPGAVKCGQKVWNWKSGIAGAGWSGSLAKGIKREIKLTHHTFPGIRTWTYAAEKALRRLLAREQPCSRCQQPSWIQFVSKNGSDKQIAFGFQLKFTWNIISYQSSPELGGQMANLQAIWGLSHLHQLNHCGNQCQ